MDRPIQVSTPLPDGTLLFEGLNGDEGLSRPFRYEVQLLSKDANLDMSALLGKPMTVTLDLATGAQRELTGFVTRIALGGTSGNHVRYVATLRPWLWLLSHEADCRIFQNMTVPDIVKQIFREGGFSDFKESLSGSYRTWDYSVQYRESDFNYVSRLLEQEGIYYYFKHEHGKHILVLADSPSAHDTVGGYEEIAFFAPGHGQSGNDSDRIHTWHTSFQVRPGAFASTDFDFERPRADLSARLQASASYPYGDLEVFDYPGEYGTSAEGEQEVRVRLEELQAEYEIASGSGTARGIGVGALFALTDFPRIDQNREYLVVSAMYTLQIGSYETGETSSESEFQCSFSAIDSKVNYRPRQLTPKPSVDGPQTAVVVGQAGEEIWTDKYGRVKVQFHWDRQGKDDEKGPCWVRVAQAWAGSAWGAIHIPRIGQEVIVDFLEGDPDQPIITGRVYNADNMPPYALPANQTQSGIKSRSTKGAGPANFNELRFEDKKGAEQVYAQAEKNLEILVKNDEHRSVGHDRSADVTNDEKVSVGHNRTENVAGDESVTIVGSRSETVGKHESVTVGGTRDLTVALADSNTVGGSHQLAVGASDSTTVGGSQSVSVGGSQSVEVGGGQTASIGGDQSLSIAGGRSLDIAKDDTVTVAGKRTASISKDYILEVANKLSINVTDEISITTGDATISLKKNGDITIKGKNISIEGSGKVNVKASGDIVLKGSKISQN